MVCGVRFRYARLPIVLGGLIAFVFIWYSNAGNSTSPRLDDQAAVNINEQTSSSGKEKGLINLPIEYQATSTQSDFCEARFGTNYLKNLAGHSAQYCEHDSLSDLTCFSSITETTSQRVDMFCIGGPADYDETIGKFVLECAPHKMSPEQIQGGIPYLTELPFYWYNTGPGVVFTDLVDLNPGFSIVPNWPTDHLPVTILVKREELVHNTWHALMEIFSTYMTLDILRMAINPSTGSPYFQESDIKNTQILFVDDYLDGPYYDLWTMFATKPVLRLKDLKSGTRIRTGKIIVPLAGGSNPLWQGDWDELDCSESTLLRAFSSRVLQFHKIATPSKPPNSPITLTYVDRTTNRRLSDQAALLETLRINHPEITINVVDLASISFPEQLSIVRSTDILVGVHGAGLTHGIFLPPRSALIEIMPFNLAHKGFRNMAKMLGNRYVAVEAQDNPDVTEISSGSWHFEDVQVDEKVFLDAIDVAIRFIQER